MEIAKSRDTSSNITSAGLTLLVNIFLIAKSRAGARCTSSMVTGLERSRRNPVGSAKTAARVVNDRVKKFKFF